MDHWSRTCRLFRISKWGIECYYHNSTKSVRVHWARMLIRGCEQAQKFSSLSVSLLRQRVHRRRDREGTWLTWLKMRKRRGDWVAVAVLLDRYTAAVVGQWLARALSAAVALGEAWVGSDAGWSKSHGGRVPGGPVAWLACVAAWLSPAAKDMTAGDTAAINAIASRATIFALICFPEASTVWWNINQEFWKM